MNKYQNGKIYKITTIDGIYIGSTIMSLKRRLWFHIHGDICASLKKYIHDNLQIEIIEYYPCDNLTQLRKREQYYIYNCECINTRQAFQSKGNRKEYKKNNDKKNYNIKKHEISQRSKYQNSWGGDHRFNNNLLQIDVNLFS